MLHWIGERAFSTAIIISLLIVIANLLMLGSPDRQLFVRNQQASQINAEQKADDGLKDQSKPDRKESDTRPETTDAQSAPPPVGTPKGQHDARHGEEEGTEFWPPFLGLRLKITDSLLALFTFGLFVATWFLYGSTRDLVEGAENTAERQLRAYVGVSDVLVEPLIVRGRPTVWIAFKNYGQTPARDYDSWAALKIAPVGETAFVKPANLTERNPRVLNPQQDTSMRVDNDDLVLTQEQLGEIMTGTMALFAYGEASFVDAFDKSQVVKFRYEYGGAATRGPLIGGGGSRRMAISKQGNSD